MLGFPTNTWRNPIPEEYGTKEGKCHMVFFSYFKEFGDLLNRFSSYSKALHVVARLNLCPFSDNADCFDALTLGHYLIGGPIGIGNCGSMAES